MFDDTSARGKGLCSCRTWHALLNTCVTLLCHLPGRPTVVARAPLCAVPRFSPAPASLRRPVRRHSAARRRLEQLQKDAVAPDDARPLPVRLAGVLWGGDFRGDGHRRVHVEVLVHRLDAARQLRGGGGVAGHAALRRDLCRHDSLPRRDGGEHVVDQARRRPACRAVGGGAHRCFAAQPQLAQQGGELRALVPQQRPAERRRVAPQRGARTRARRLQVGVCVAEGRLQDVRALERGGLAAVDDADVRVAAAAEHAADVQRRVRRREVCEHLLNLAHRVAVRLPRVARRASHLAHLELDRRRGVAGEVRRRRSKVRDEPRGQRLGGRRGERSVHGGGAEAKIVCGAVVREEKLVQLAPRDGGCVGPPLRRERARAPRELGAHVRQPRGACGARRLTK
mmetsp:Transcript_34243/g.111938  ORF Transcript_34243/g.111938 Transcript_34243/m.111938 type:complete len:397 (+) Transcript_34243:54-1244(+)